MDQKEKIILSALALADQLGWERVTLSDIADDAKVDLATLYDLFECKTDILVGFGRMIDRQILGEVSLEKCEQRQGVASPQDSTHRDLLFDLLMDRFEALNGHRAGVVAVLESFKLDPKQAVIGLPHLCRSMTWMLEACGISTSGIKGALRVSGLVLLYLKAAKVWVKDESADLAKVMAALDKDLARVHGWAETLGL